MRGMIVIPQPVTASAKAGAKQTSGCRGAQLPAVAMTPEEFLTSILPVIPSRFRRASMEAEMPGVLSGRALMSFKRSGVIPLHPWLGKESVDECFIWTSSVGKHKPCQVGSRFRVPFPLSERPGG